jgi:hypothetical protein
MAPWCDLDLHPDSIDLLAVAAVVGGLSVCLFGLRLWRVLLGAAGLASGLFAGCALAAAQAPDRTEVMIGLGLSTGCVLMVILAGLPRLGTFVALAAVGWIAGRLLGGPLQAQDMAIVSGLTGALVVSLLPFCFDFDKSAIVVVSALAGAWSAVWGATLFFGGGFERAADAAALFAAPSDYRIELGAVVLLALIGLVLQSIDLLHSGPDAKALRRAMALADLPTRRRVAILANLRCEGLVTRAEYHHHLVRVLADARTWRTQPTEASKPLTASITDEPTPAAVPG